MDENGSENGASTPAKANKEANKPDTGTRQIAPQSLPVAVALKDSSTGDTPNIVATGRGHVAEQILELAFANGVKVREDADLVQVLAALDVESEVPLEALAAVTEILNYVYMANRNQPIERSDPHEQDPSPVTGETANASDQDRER